MEKYYTREIKRDSINMLIYETGPFIVLDETLNVVRTTEYTGTLGKLKRLIHKDICESSRAFTGIGIFFDVRKFNDEYYMVVPFKKSNEQIWKEG